MNDSNQLVDMVEHFVDMVEHFASKEPDISSGVGGEQNLS